FMDEAGNCTNPDVAPFFRRFAQFFAEEKRLGQRHENNKNKTGSPHAERIKMATR
ncbi:hypothetical protein PSYPI_45433, partial [Pseudomonas syringae pv. pisi str. 1704B]